GLLSKIVAPVSSNEFVEDIKSSAAWNKVADGSLKVVSRLMGSSGRTGKNMCRLIANNRNAVKNLEVVLEMDIKSNSGIIELQMRAIEVLTQLALHHPASASFMMRREKLIERALHIFLAADWMEDYLKDEKKKIEKPTLSQKNTSPIPSMGRCIDNLIKKVKEKRAKQARETRVEKKMKEVQKTASRLKEKAGEALAMLSSDSEAIKSFTGCDDDIHRLTELLDFADAAGYPGRLCDEAEEDGGGQHVCHPCMPGSPHAYAQSRSAPAWGARALTGAPPAAVHQCAARADTRSAATLESPPV
uniref:Uncharacterized protein n=1 Tax=Aegilops tauschii subsp. strangulata TaxID=200361 RepID=A0A453DF73_AEGTS